MTARLIALDGLAAEIGLCWTCPAPGGPAAGDSSEQPTRSTLRLFEDDREIGPAHSMHEDIRQHGRGRFSHWGDRLYFSAVAANARPDQCRYTALVESGETALLHAGLAASANLDALSPEQRYAWGERVFSVFVPEVKLSEYGRSFFRDREFRADYERFDRQNYRSFDRKFAMRELLKLALQRRGDVAECGVYRGASAFVMARAMRAAGGGRRLHLFDSFAGVSQPEAIDGSYWSAGNLACSEVEVAANLAEFADLVSIHAGWIPARFGDVAEARFCFVHIDVDLFQPTRDALEFFCPRMVAGGLIVCDDYGFETCPGARQAMQGFFAGRPEPIVELPTGQGLVVIEPRAAPGFGKG